MKTLRFHRGIAHMLLVVLLLMAALASCFADPAFAAVVPPEAVREALEPPAVPVVAEAQLHFAGTQPALRVDEATTAPAPQRNPAPHRLPAGFLSLGFLAAGMVALTKDRDTPRKDGIELPYLVAADTTIYAGSLLVLNAGYAEGGTTALNLFAVGRAEQTVDNAGGAAGALTVTARRGVFRFANDGSIAQADVGKTAYIVDDQTVADNNGAGTRSVAGIIRAVDSGGAWVEI